jgi:hypothetical protein
MEEDPSERHDLVGKMPQWFQQLLLAYEHCTRKNKVLPTPAVYDHPKQLMLNTLHARVRERFIIALLLSLVLLPFYIRYRVNSGQIERR